MISECCTFSLPNNGAIRGTISRVEDKYKPVNNINVLNLKFLVHFFEMKRLIR